MMRTTVFFCILVASATGFRVFLPQARRGAISTIAGGACMALEKADPLPPTLSSPVFSLATLNDDGSTNMNILTYAVPVGIRPSRKWIISLWQGTLSHENFAKRRKGVLQLLRRQHMPLVKILGKQSGRAEGVDKMKLCAEAGFEWSHLLETQEKREMFEKHTLLLPNCAAYYTLSFPLDQDYQNAGEHDAVMCDLQNVYTEQGGKAIEAEREGEEAEDIVMYTAWLRSKGVIE